MKFDSSRTVIWLTGLWIYILVTMAIGGMDVSPIFIILTFIPVIAVYLFIVSRENKTLSKKELAARKPQGLLGIPQKAPTLRDFVESFIAVFGAVILGTLTAMFVVNPQLGIKLTDTIRVSGVTCERDASKIVTLPVNKTIKGTDATITVHNITYNVPQKSEHPIEFGDDWHCAKATLVEVTVDRPKAAQDGTTRSISLQASGNDNVTPRYYGLDEYKDYISEHNITVLNGQDFTHKDEAYKKQGWWLFRLPQDYPNKNSLVYSERAAGSTDTKKVSIELPKP